MCWKDGTQGRRRVVVTGVMCMEMVAGHTALPQIQEQLPHVGFVLQDTPLGKLRWNRVLRISQA